MSLEGYEKDLLLFFDLLTTGDLTAKQYAGGSEVDITLEARIPLEAAQRIQKLISCMSGRWAFQGEMPPPIE
jgi:hypothetical protein